jgi:hypothetical protein
MILPAALNNALQSGSGEAAASAVIVSEILNLESEVDVETIATEITVIQVEV